MILAESEGVFDLDVWERVVEKGREMCCPSTRADTDGDGEERGASLGVDVGGDEFAKRVVAGKIEGERAWVEGLRG